MKIGICTGVENMEKAIAAGADFIEVGNMKLAALSDEEFEKVANLAAAHPGFAYCTNGLVPSDVRLTGPDVDYDKIREFSEMSFARLARLGVKILVFGSSKAKIVPEGFSFDEAWDQLVNVTRIFSDVAAKHGQTVVIEPLRHEECNIINEVTDSVKLAQLTDRENVKAHVDFYHLMQNGEKLSDLAPCVPFLGHVHIASPVKRTAPTFDDGANYKAFFDVLRAGGYDGTVSYEGKGVSDPDELRTLVSFLKSL